MPIQSFILINRLFKGIWGFDEKALDKKHLQKVKDVIYDKETGVIKNIPVLVFNNTTRKFYLKKDILYG